MRSAQLCPPPLMHEDRVVQEGIQNCVDLPLHCWKLRFLLGSLHSVPFVYSVDEKIS